MKKEQKTKGSLLLLNIDLIPTTASGFPKITQEEKQLFLKGLDSLQQEKGQMILFCLYSDQCNKITWQKGIRIYNSFAQSLSNNCYEFRAISLGNNLFDPYHKREEYQYEMVYPEYEIANTIYMMGEEKVSLISPVKEEQEFTFIKGNNILEIAQNLNKNRVRKKQNDL